MAHNGGGGCKMFSQVLEGEVKIVFTFGKTMKICTITEHFNPSPDVIVDSSLSFLVLSVQIIPLNFILME